MSEMKLRLGGLCRLSTAVAVAVALGATPVFAGVMQYFDPNSAVYADYGHGYNYWHIKAGEKHKAVGELEIYVGDTFEELTFAGTGSGTVIHDPFNQDSVWVLTAAHVVDTATYMAFNLPQSNEWENIDGITYRSTSYDVYFADEWYVPASWSGFEEDSGVGNDIAMVRLSRSPEADSGVQALHIADENPGEGTEFEIVGFGTTGDGYSGPVYYTGHRRAGNNHLEYTLAGDRILMSDFDAPRGSEYEWLVDDIEDYPGPLEYMIAPGDSGGPDLVGNTVFGVHSFGVGLYDGVTDFSFLDYAGSISTAAWFDWIVAVMNGTVGAHVEGFTLGEEFSAILDDATATLKRDQMTAAIMAAMIEKYGELLAAEDPRAAEFAEWISFTNLPSAGDPRYEHYQQFFTGLAPGYGTGTIPEPASVLMLAGLGAAGLLTRRRS